MDTMYYSSTLELVNDVALHTPDCTTAFNHSADLYMDTVNEATAMTLRDIDQTETGIGIDRSFQIANCTDDVIARSGVKPVYSSLMFNSGYEPAEGGLFDPIIFGSSADERKRFYAYIDLKQKYFHPYVFEVICKLSKAFEKIASGTVCGYIEKGTSELKLAKGPDDPNFNDMNTGIPWLIQNFHKFKWKTSDALIRKERIRLLDDLDDNELFISKFLVVPIFYRDKEVVNGRVSVPEVNREYNKLVQYTANTDDDLFASFNNALYYRVQNIMVGLRQMGQDLISKKNGHYHRAILGKSITHGTSDVISTTVLNEVQHPKDNPVDMFHTGVPLSKCLVVGYPFISKYVLDFFEDTFKNTDSLPMYVKGKDDVKLATVEIKDHTLIYDKTHVDKIMKRYLNTPSWRFEPIKVYRKNGGECYISFTGLCKPIEKGHQISGINHRPFTWTDLFYIAACETISDKYLYTTRFPMTSFSSIFPAKCAPISTIKTQYMIINGKEYKNYPVIDVTLPPDVVATKFIDTVTMSNLYLTALGGDFDGDTVQSKLCFTLEANKEADDIAHSLKHFLSITGDMLRDVHHEAYLTFYNMTRRK